MYNPIPRTKMFDDEESKEVKSSEVGKVCKNFDDKERKIADDDEHAKNNQWPSAMINVCKEIVLRDIGGLNVVDSPTKGKRSNFKEIKLAIAVLASIKDHEDKLWRCKTTGGSMYLEDDILTFYPPGIGFGKHLITARLEELKKTYHKLVGKPPPKIDN